MKRLTFHQVAGPVSLLLRLPLANGNINDIASQHKQIIQVSRKVWLGVFSPLSSRTLEVLKSRGEHLYMMQIGCHLIQKGIITGIAKFLSAPELRLVPHYYKEKALTPLVKFWVQLSSLEPVIIDELDELQVARTGTKPLDLFQSRVSVAIINRTNARASR